MDQESSEKRLGNEIQLNSFFFQENHVDHRNNLLSETAWIKLVQKLKNKRVKIKSKWECIRPQFIRKFKIAPKPKAEIFISPSGQIFVLTDLPSNFVRLITERNNSNNINYIKKKIKNINDCRCVRASYKKPIKTNNNMSMTPIKSFSTWEKIRSRCIRIICVIECGLVFFFLLCFHLNEIVSSHYSVQNKEWRRNVISLLFLPLMAILYLPMFGWLILDILCHHYMKKNSHQTHHQIHHRRQGS